MKKTLITGLLVTAVSTSCFAPVSAFAENKQPQLQQTNIQNFITINTLSNSIRTLGSQTPLIQGYGLVLLKQPDFKVNAMSSLTADQRIARKHVQEWMDEYNPKLFNLNQEMMGFSTRFNNYYSKLYELAGKVNEDPQAKEEFVSAYNRLQDQVQTIQDNMEKTLIDLNWYKDELVQDSESLSKRANTAIQSLNGSNGETVQLRAQIKQIQEEIQNELTKILNRSKEIIGSSISIGKQAIDISKTGAESKTIDFASIENLGNEIANSSDGQVREASNNIKQKRQQLIPLIQKLSQNEIQAAQITLIEDQVGSFTNLIKRQLKTFEILVKDWKSLNETMTQMKINSDAGVTVDSKALQTQLTQLKNFSDEMIKQTNQYEEFVTKVEVK
ncbi:non-hemolytic enterotoxin subunit A [Bacillus gaemokensis]|uniref:Enterotoxin n=1 Tax=Bacillus gaemokensis TaxID=574375 RepID=A0A073KCM5_9BACI|nr:HBL/NHE enterotoxin family protein [Bacillus gaemokensis]KEK24276.1 enterotoxin [Bacillus gaemokensis]KYG38208.1 enterotoxin [Bacillus gaemokensis]